MNSATRLLLAVAVGVGSAGALWCAQSAFRAPRTSRNRSPHRRTVDRNRIVIAVAVALAVLMTTRWPVAAAAAATLVFGWGKLFASKDATNERRRLDGIAKWLEDLRDLQQGSNLDLIETLTQSAERAPKVIEPHLLQFAGRVAHHVPLSDALLALADELNHSVADTAVAAMVFASGHASGGALFETFAELAETARDELTARDRIDRLRVNFERSMRRMLVILAVLIAYMVLVTGETLKPYRTPAGQLWLVVPIACWTGSLFWLRSLARYDRPGRYLSRAAFAEAAVR